MYKDAETLIRCPVGSSHTGCCLKNEASQLILMNLFLNNLKAQASVTDLPAACLQEGIQEPDFASCISWC